jgi:ribosome-associated protein
MAAPRVRPEEVAFSAIRAQGAGGQNVNKVSNAAQLRFDIRASSLPEEVKERLLNWPDQRISTDGVVVITAQESRSLVHNRRAALARLQALVDLAAERPRVRRPTRPTKGSVQRRLQAKAQRAQIKAGRSGRPEG